MGTRSEFMSQAMGLSQRNVFVKAPWRNEERVGGWGGISLLVGLLNVSNLTSQLCDQICVNCGIDVSDKTSCHVN